MQINAQDLAEVLKSSKNIILHGAPGTGKTHLAKQIAEELGAEYEFVQFHPSYDYTDFVEGLRPVNENRQVVFKRKDGVFKEFCKKALSGKKISDIVQDELNEIFFEKFGFHANVIELLNTENICEQIKDFLEDKIHDIMKYYHNLFARDFPKINIFSGCYFDTITQKNGYEAEYSSYRWTVTTSGHYADNRDVIKFMAELFKGSNIDCGEQKLQYDIANTIYNYFIQHRPFVFIIDEINRGEISKIFGELFYLIDPDKRGEDYKSPSQYQNLIENDDKFGDGFYIPENVYIIATMNDIDRSVEPIDFAFRRRFTWINVKASDTQNMLDKIRDENLAQSAKDKMNALNDEISNIDELDESYHIGAAYFLKLNNFSDNNKFKLLWEYHLEPLLREYLCGRPANEIDEIIKKLETTYNNA